MRPLLYRSKMVSVKHQECFGYLTLKKKACKKLFYFQATFHAQLNDVPLLASLSRGLPVIAESCMIQRPDIHIRRRRICVAYESSVYIKMLNCPKVQHE